MHENRKEEEKEKKRRELGEAWKQNKAPDW